MHGADLPGVQYPFVCLHLQLPKLSAGGQGTLRSVDVLVVVHSRPVILAMHWEPGEMAVQASPKVGTLDFWVTTKTMT